MLYLWMSLVSKARHSATSYQLADDHPIYVHTHIDDKVTFVGCDVYIPAQSVSECLSTDQPISPKLQNDADINSTSVTLPVIRGLYIPFLNQAPFIPIPLLLCVLSLDTRSVTDALITFMVLPIQLTGTLEANYLRYS